MANTMDDILLNWKGSLIPDMRGETEKVAELMDRKLREGISIDSAVEIISVGGYPMEVVKRVAEARRREIVAANTPKPSDPEYVPEPPKTYADVAPRMRALVLAMPAEDIVNLLVGKSKNSPSLVRLTEKERRSFRNIVATAAQVDDDASLAEIDRWVRPHFETAIVDSEILATKLAGDERTTVEDTGDDTYIVEDADGRRSAVDLSTMSCTCSRYVFGSFAHTGLACEHILCVRAAVGDETKDRMQRSAQPVPGNFQSGNLAIPIQAPGFPQIGNAAGGKQTSAWQNLQNYMDMYNRETDPVKKKSYGDLANIYRQQHLKEQAASKGPRPKVGQIPSANPPSVGATSQGGPVPNAAPAGKLAVPIQAPGFPVVK